MQQNRSIPWFSGERFTDVSVSRFTRLLADLVDTGAALPDSVSSWHAYAELLLTGLRSPRAELPTVREPLNQLVLVLPAGNALAKFRFAPGPDSRAAVWLQPAGAPKCRNCGMAPDACVCERPAFDTAPAFPFVGERYMLTDDGLGILVQRREDGASVRIQSADERAAVERDILAMQQIGIGETDIADEVGDTYDAVLE